MMTKSNTSRQQRYQKAPVKMELEGIFKASRWLRFLASTSFFLALLFFFLMNPFLRAKQATQVLQDFTANSLSEKLTVAQASLATLPDLLAQLPSELEKQSFRAFDWAEMQIKSIDWQVISWRKQQAVVEETVPALVPSVDPQSLPFYIEIPSLDLYQKVNPQVDPNNELEYRQALEDGVAHALGSAFPGEGKLVYIFGHSTNGAWNVDDYNAVFYQIKDLAEGDKITLYWGSERFDYQVVDYAVLAREDSDFVNRQQGEDLLILQTCWPPGTSWQRLFISAEPS